MVKPSALLATCFALIAVAAVSEAMEGVVASTIQQQLETPAHSARPVLALMDTLLRMNEPLQPLEVIFGVLSGVVWLLRAAKVRFSALMPK